MKERSKEGDQKKVDKKKLLHLFCSADVIVAYPFELSYMYDPFRILSDRFQLSVKYSLS